MRERVVSRRVDSGTKPESQDRPADAASAPDAGAPLPAPVRAQMERRFGADLSGVRVHESERPREMGALAFTQGTDIHFAPGAYNPDTAEGDKLIAHELAHVVQQRQGGVAGPAEPEPAAGTQP